MRRQDVENWKTSTWSHGINNNRDSRKLAVSTGKRTKTTLEEFVNRAAYHGLRGSYYVAPDPAACTRAPKDGVYRTNRTGHG